MSIDAEQPPAWYPSLWGGSPEQGQADPLESLDLELSLDGILQDGDFLGTAEHLRPDSESISASPGPALEVAADGAAEAFTPERWVFTAKRHRPRRSTGRSRSAALAPEPHAGDVAGHEMEMAAEAAAGPEPLSQEASRPHRPRGGAHRRRRHKPAPVDEAPLSVLEPAPGEQAVLIGMPEGSRFAPMVRALAIAVPVAGATVAFLARLR